MIQQQSTEHACDQEDQHCVASIRIQVSIHISELGAPHERRFLASGYSKKNRRL